VEAETMLNEAEWNARYDQQSLERLKETEEQLETLLEEHLKSIGDGPAGQESN
jgi:tripartite-type tricarboxylate transporter receptor subunit TctC